MSLRDPFRAALSSFLQYAGEGILIAVAGGLFMVVVWQLFGLAGPSVGCYGGGLAVVGVSLMWIWHALREARLEYRIYKNAEIVRKESGPDKKDEEK
jgi:hypothetical protein